MNKRMLTQSALLASIIATTVALAQTPPASKPTAHAKPATKADSTKQADEGQRKFDANFGRCHSFLVQLSPSITGTVVRDMRMRANLSGEDAEDMLLYLVS